MRLRERLENSHQVFGGNADAIVPHGQHRFGTALFERDGDAAARLGVLRRILDQIADDLAQSARITLDVHGRSRQHERHHVTSLLDERLERVHRVAGDRGHIEMFRPDLNQAVANARQVQEVVHEQFPGGRVRVALPQQVDGVCDRRERVSKLMSQHGDELVLPLTAGDQPSGDVRASGDVVDREQQLFGPVGIAGDSPRAQRHHLMHVWRNVPGQVPIFHAVGAAQRRAQSLVQFRDVPPAVTHFVEESAFNLFAGDLKVRRERCIHSQDAHRSIKHRQRLADRLDDGVRVGARGLGGPARCVHFDVQPGELLVSAPQLVDRRRELLVGGLQFLL